MVLVHRPTHTCLPQPLSETLQLLLTDTHTTTHRRPGQQFQDGLHFKATLWQLQQLQQGLRSRQLPDPISNRIGDMWLRGIKHCFYQRRIQLHIRCHHHHIRGPEFRPVLKQRQQTIMQHLQLTHRTVTGMHLYRGIMPRKHPTILRQLQQIRLQTVQSVRTPRQFKKLFFPVRFQTIHRIQKIPTLPAHGSQQPIPHLHQPCPGPFLHDRLCHPCRRLQIPPVFPAGIQQKQMYIHV